LLVGEIVRQTRKEDFSLIELGVIIAILVGLSQVGKNLGLPTKYVPLMNLILGVVAGLTTVEAPTIQEKFIFGVMAGLSASGLYDQSKLFTK
jgi:hypothetical protein